VSFPDRDEDGFGPDDLVRLVSVSRETLTRVRRFLDVLDEWRTRINLIGPGEGRHIWRRHVLDSLQLADLLGHDDLAIADLGSGAGFPGLILACAMAERPGASVTLVEKSVRKCQFLEAAVVAVGLPAKVLNQRLEDPAPRERFDVVTARALAPLPRLLGYAHAWLKPSGKALLMKGRDAVAELTLARESWTFDLSTRTSLSSPEGQILAVSALKPRRAS
jgi:16S rRNA (guanine527-N7)-methyltransferase